MVDKKVDESWKAQAKKDPAAPESSVKEPRTPKTEPSAEDRHSPERENADTEMPPADFSMFISSLGLQALMALGEIEHPITHKKDPDLAQAKYLIDTIGMLQDKTKGNLSPEESSVIDQMLYELRLKYVAVNK
ncbi:MAG: DUF1844 domain-containing protein [Candidatus Omnitrophica bacterium]|nr:DUF1844 domain-containing protein [Candidatus Omnitrophota bacterium]